MCISRKGQSSESIPFTAARHNYMIYLAILQRYPVRNDFFILAREQTITPRGSVVMNRVKPRKTSSYFHQGSHHMPLISPWHDPSNQSFTYDNVARWMHSRPYTLSPNQISRGHI